VSHRYDTTSRLQDPGSTLNRVLRLIGENKRVIDIGSGPGVIASALAQCHCVVTVVDSDVDALRMASEHAADGYHVDLNDPDWSRQLPAGTRYDVVVLADVLEHLLDPATTLRHAQRLLNEDGYVVISIPNVSHRGLLAALWHGRFGYRDIGLLDRTHVRFFGADDLEPLLAAVGLAIDHIEFVTAHPRATEFAGDWEALPLRTKLALRSSRYGNVYQFVLRARPASAALSGLRLKEVAVPPIHDPLWLEVMRSLSRTLRNHGRTGAA
jgi:2-polyprenyl-3-methyl-5-hydroxy-6-metoxy-1,4-benzoquinol methylase